MDQDFCHLHTHSIYSVLDGTIKFDELFPYLKELGMSSCALTDHGALGGVIEFIKAAKKHDIKPIIGIEAYLTDDEDGIDDNQYKTQDNYHTVLLAQNEKGLENLYWLASNAESNNFYYRPRIDIRHFETRAEGLIATSACLGGIVAKQGRIGLKRTDYSVNEELAIRAAHRMKELFDGRFYLEIQDNDMKEQQILNAFLLKASKSEKIPLVITSDAHYLRAEDHETHALVMAQQLKSTLKEYKDDGGQMKYGTGFYVRSPKEMFEGALRCGSEEAFWNTLEISKQCNVDIKLGEYKPPIFDIGKQDDYNEFKQWSAARWECAH